MLKLMNLADMTPIAGNSTVAQKEEDYLWLPPCQWGNADELCAMVDGSCQCTIVLPENCLGYGLVVPFLAYRFALWLRIMKT